MRDLTGFTVYLKKRTENQMQATQTAMFDSRAKSSLVRGTPLTIGKLPRECGEGGEGEGNLLPCRVPSRVELEFSIN